MARAKTSAVARFAIAGLIALLLIPAVGVRPASTATPPLPTFGNPTISGIQGFGFEQDLRLDTHGRVYTSVPGSLGSNISYVWRSLDGGQSFKWIPAATQPVGKLLPMCNGGGDTELGTDSADRLYINDLALANYGTARSDDQGRTLTALPTCTSTPRHSRLERAPRPTRPSATNSSSRAPPCRAHRRPPGCNSVLPRC
jgi:hypothetical protein